MKANSETVHNAKILYDALEDLIVFSDNSIGGSETNALRIYLPKYNKLRSLIDEAKFGLINIDNQFKQSSIDKINQTLIRWDKLFSEMQNIPEMKDTIIVGLESLRNEFEELEIPEKTEISDSMDKNNELPKSLKWEGAKYELCELIRAIQLSKHIYKNGRPINQKDLLELFMRLFPNQNLNGSNFNTNLIQGYNRDKRQIDNQFYIKDLQPKYLSYLTDLIKKDSKRDEEI